MAKIIHQIHFKHTDGSLKKIPGVRNVADLAPKLVQEVETKFDGNGPVERPIMRVDKNHIVKLTLLNEEVDLKLTEREKKQSVEVQNLILARRAAEADAIIQANDALRDRLRSYEQRGGIEVINWDVAVNADSPEAQEGLVAELSPIAIADMESRGIPIPDRFKRQVPVAPPNVEPTITVKQSVKKPKE